MNSNWHLSDIPDLSGKVFIVTGGNTGLGAKSVEVLSRHGASIVLACRDQSSGLKVIENLNLNEKTVDVIELDLININSIKRFAKKVTSKYSRLDCLINNAGVVNLEHLSRTDDGHEMHMATNHYGHFALTGLLFDLLTNTQSSRVVTVTSGGYKAGEIDFGDIAWNKRKYSRLKSYCDSKLANLLFSRELQKRFQLTGSTSISVAAHPGLTATPRQQSIGIGGLLSKHLASSLDTGVAPQLLAATGLNVKKLDFYGPRFGIWGSPKKLTIKGNAANDVLASQLWKHTEQITGIYY